VGTNLIAYVTLLIVLAVVIFFLTASALQTRTPTTDFLLSLLVAHFIADKITKVISDAE
jgi:hypothetical protein